MSVSVHSAVAAFAERPRAATRSMRPSTPLLPRATTLRSSMAACSRPSLYSASCSACFLRKSVARATSIRASSIWSWNSTTESDSARRLQNEWPVLRASFWK